jgi:Domain of unknown function (DUF5615)
MSPKLVEVANRAGYVAHHVQYRQWQSKADQALLAFIRAEDLTIVTNNWKDFEPMLRREEVHPGAVVLPDDREASFHAWISAPSAADEILRSRASGCVALGSA